MFLNIVAAAVTVLTFAAIVRKVEVRLALLTGGLIMALLSMNPQAWSEAFFKSMTVAGLISVILPVMGFAAVMELTGCNAHLVKLLTDPLIRVRLILIPGAMLVTYLINTAVSSAAGCTAAVGVVLIPAMMAAGVHPAMAAAAVLAGTWGSVWSPGSPHPAVIAKIANASVMDVILAHKVASLSAAGLVAVLLFAEAKLFRQDRDWTPEKAGSIFGQASGKTQPSLAQVSVLRALIPVVPLILLLVTVPQFGITTKWIPKGLPVLDAMVIGTVLGMLVTWTGPTQITKTFFDGMGRAYSGVIGIIIAAGVFIGGLEAAGVIKALIETLKTTQSAVPLLGTFGPMLLAILSGSGDAATLAFNNAVTPHAAQFGIQAVDLGNLAWIGGALGRSMSPVSAACIIAAGFAGMSPFELAKRNAVPMIVAAVAVMLLLG
ncbi:MAG TPA: C4-dicarboxylate transporter DcuC [Candidatus Methylomirabilis sp.]|nr:C4-dicarboxylate transporter DcuC [Candidatus Methylomirabilis sp.]